ncbi:hypothetical protein [Hyphobacterium sp.]|uniref:hypothetical protein n=1 Tax=Hyphobacterium sp. TaxID=2004662 RepID=UPI0037489EA5
MKLFNIRDQQKMRVQDCFELTLLKQSNLLIFHAGHVKLRGDRYLYNDQPIVELKKNGEFISINCIEPVFAEELVLPDEAASDGANVTSSTLFKIGTNCRSDFQAILEHIKSVNDQHVFRSRLRDNASIVVASSDGLSN